MGMQRQCFRNGVSFSPWFDAAEELGRAVPEVAKDGLDCQTRCSHKQWCKKFQYNVFTHECRLMRTWPANGTLVPGDYLISGPPQCPGHVAFNMTVENVDFEKLHEDPQL